MATLELKIDNAAIFNNQEKISKKRNITRFAEALINGMVNAFTLDSHL